MINQEGLMKLADDLVLNTEMYDQMVWGTTACGTVCCMAGFCYLGKVGLKQFERTAPYEMEIACREAGIEQLGLISGGKWLASATSFYGLRNLTCPQIFANPDYWPIDLRSEYNESKSKRERAIVALKALQRLLPDGNIHPDPTAVVNHIPQLEFLTKDYDPKTVHTPIPELARLMK